QLPPDQPVDESLGVVEGGYLQLVLLEPERPRRGGGAQETPIDHAFSRKPRHEHARLEGDAQVFVASGVGQLHRPGDQPRLEQLAPPPRPPNNEVPATVGRRHAPPGSTEANAGDALDERRVRRPYLAHDAHARQHTSFASQDLRCSWRKDSRTSRSHSWGT